MTWYWIWLSFIFFASKFLLGKNVIFGVYKSSSGHIDHKKTDIQLVFQDHKGNLV